MSEEPSRTSAAEDGGGGTEGGEPVLAQGRLHPATLLLRAVDLARRAAIPAVLVAVQVARGEAGAAGTWALLLLMVLLVAPFAAAELLGYWHYRYRLTATELQITQGVLSRQERRIPVRRIQDLGTEQSVLRRMLGLVTVRVETASTEGAEASIDSITQADADHLRQALRETTSAPRAATETPQARPALFRAERSELLLRGLTDNAAGLVFAGVAVGLRELLRLADVDPVRWVPEQLLPWLSDAAPGPMQVVLAVAAIVAAAVVVGWVLSALLTLVRYHGFAIVQDGDVLQRRYGLFTTHVHALPRRRVQCVRLEQTWLRRLAGIVVVRVDHAGSAMGDERERAARTLFVPAGRVARVEALLPSILPESDVPERHWQRTSLRIIRRHALRGLVLGGALAAVGWPLLRWSSLWALALVLPFAAAGLLAYRRLGYALADDHIAVRWGMLGTYRALIPLRGLQAVELRRNPLERIQRIARLRFVVAGGGAVVLPNVPRRTASGLLQEVARGAARKRFAL